MEIIEPCGFPLDDRRLRRAAMDYGALPRIDRHPSFDQFQLKQRDRSSRIVLLTRFAGAFHHEFVFQRGDVLLAGRESAGVPVTVAQAADEQIMIPMAPGVRSLNVITALAIVAGSAMQQLGGFETLTRRDRDTDV